MKIAHVTTVPSSLQVLLLNQLLDLREAGYAVTGLSAPGDEVSVIEAVGLRHLSVPMTRFPFSPLADVRSLLALYRIFRREGFTLVHTHTPKAGIYGRWAARLARVPVVLHTSHGFIFHEGTRRLYKSLFVALERSAAKCCDLIFSVNREDIETAVRERICPRDKIELLGEGGIGIDTRLFDPARFPPESIVERRKREGLPEECRVVGFVGRLVREKGLPELLQAAQRVRERVPEVRFLIIGPVDSAKPDCLTPEVAREYGVDDICLFTGNRQDMPELYSIMDVFVLPSHREGLPRSPMEASAMKVPCVVTDIRGCREVVEHNRNGLRVPAGDVQALSDALVDILNHPEESRQWGEEGRRMALERFDEQLVFERVRQRYAQLLESAGISADSRLDTRVPGLYGGLGKRLLDLLLTVPALVLLSPVLAVTALLIRLKLGSPVLFRHQRPGFKGKPFTLLKFRTMTDKRDAQGNLLPDAKRLTRLGQFLRSASLDELPELVNVLKGEMSLVGPRPLLTQYLKLYSHEQRRRHDVKPGLTGWAQVKGRNAITWEQKFALDVWYVDHVSLWLDLRILLTTVWKTLKREGISQEGHATMEEFRSSGNR